MVNRIALDTTEAQNTSIDLDRNEIKFIKDLLDELVFPWVDSHAPFNCSLTTKDSNVVYNGFVVLEHVLKVLPLLLDITGHLTVMFTPGASPQQSVRTRWSYFGQGMF